MIAELSTTVLHCHAERRFLPRWTYAFVDSIGALNKIHRSFASLRMTSFDTGESREVRGND
jgi:hypothetical protein